MTATADALPPLECLSTPGTADFLRDTVSGARHMPSGEIENLRMTTHPKDIEHLGYKGNFKDGYLGNFIWPTHFEGYDVKDKSGNLIQRNVNMSYVDMSGKELGKSMSDVIGPEGKPLSGVTNYQLLFGKTTGNYNVRFKFADGRSVTGKTSWAGLERITWDEKPKVQ